MRYFIMISALLACVMLSAPVFAAPPAGPPAIVIRFNQPNVAYDVPLAEVANKAKSIKPSVAFTLIHYVPATASPQTSADVEAVAKTLKALGISDTQISTQRIPANVDTSEVHVFVG